MVALTLRFLGTPLVQREEAPLALGRVKALALLAYLAVTGKRHERDMLALLLWPGADSRRRFGSLRSALFILQQALGERWLDSDRTWLALRSHPELEVDVTRFQTLVEAARGEPAGLCSPAALARLAEAVALYRGDFLQELELEDCPAFADWQRSQAEHLRGLLRQALGWLTTGLTEARQLEEALPHARHLVRLAPLDEEAHRQLMCLYAWCGRRAEALAQYESCAATLQQELGVHPSEETQSLRALLQRGQRPPPPGQAVPAPARSPTPRSAGGGPRLQASRLPAPALPFVGREEELRSVARALEQPECRLLTLSGPGGVGKTCLALELARRTASSYADGACFVPLDRVSAAEHLASTVAEALRLAPGAEASEAWLVEHLRERHMLLVLDGFEHLPGAAPLLAELIARAPRLRLLITSRERLNLRVGQEKVLGGLSAQGEALEFFLQAAARVQPSFSLRPGEEALVARFCQRLEGLPLALELAAAWVRHLSVEEIANRLEGDLDFLSGPRDMPERHRSLRATFEHSWRLLSAEEQQALRRLSMFRGGFTWASGLEVASLSLPTLSALEAKCLLRRTPAGRYELHELIRHYAAEALAAVPEEQHRAHTRHAEYTTALAEQHGAWLRGPRHAESLAVLSAELENVRAALRWAARAGRLELLSRALEGLGLVEASLGHLQAAEALLGELVPAVRAAASPGPGRLLLGRLLCWQGRFALELAAHPRAASLLEEGVRLLREEGPQAELGAALVLSGRLALAQGNLAAADWSFQASLQVARVVGERRLVAEALGHLSIVAFHQGHRSAARRMLERSFAAFRNLGDERSMATCLASLADMLLFEGSYAHALEAVREGLEAARAAGDSTQAALLLALRARVHTLRGELREAERDYEGCLRDGRTLGHPEVVACALHGLGEVHLLGERLEPAARLLADSCALRERLNARRGLAESLASLGSLALAQGQAPRARAHFDMALRIAMEVDAMPLVLELLVRLCELPPPPDREPRLLHALSCLLTHPYLAAPTRERALRRAASLGTAEPAPRCPEFPALVNLVLEALAEPGGAVRA